MRKIIAILFAAALLTGCTEAGKKGEGEVSIIANGKEYNFIRVVPADGYDPIWILVPKDSSNGVPTVVTTQNGKSKTQTIIIN